MNRTNENAKLFHYQEHVISRGTKLKDSEGWAVESKNVIREKLLAQMQCVYNRRQRETMENTEIIR